MKKAAPAPDPLSEATRALTDLTQAMADQWAAQERQLDARHRLAAALARMEHPTPPLNLVPDDE